VRADTTRVVLARGHHPTPWGLRPWEELPPRFDAALLVTRGTRYDLDGVGVRRLPVRALRDLLPHGRAGDLAALALRDRYLDAGPHLDAADVVHAEDLSLWFSAQLANARRRHDYRLVVTVWETIPLLDAYRNPHARRFRAATLQGADLFLASSERARDGLLLEGVAPDRIELSYPGVDVDRFAAAAATSEGELGGHLILSPARLEWEKGHHDLLRAFAALHRGIVPAPREAVENARLLIVGSGPEEKRLRAHADELGIGGAVDLRSVPYGEMPALYARASCMVLASLPRSGCGLFPGDVPRCFWEEQFGLVLAEAMAARLAIAASRSGAIPEIAGDEASYFAPGDWLELAALLADRVLSREPRTRAHYPRERVRRYSIQAASARLAAAYDRVSG
jgi:glycosyltransferase involved in cell wall biosynthesis